MLAQHCIPLHIHDLPEAQATMRDGRPVQRDGY
jgi:hypothetical protein